MLRACTEFIYSADRYAIVRVPNFILINVYLPCKGSSRQLICQDILDDIWSYRERFNHCNCLIGGDLNADLSSNEGTANIINSFLLNHDFINCDKSLYKSPTYRRLRIQLAQMAKKRQKTQNEFLHRWKALEMAHLAVKSVCTN